jgi:thioredoxin 1
MSAVEIQRKVASGSAFHALTRLPGLVVIDCHAAWCGPCGAVFSTFKRFFYELVDRRVTFAAADVDAIPQLARFRGHAQSAFLFFRDGALRNSVAGVDLPTIARLVKELAPPAEDYEEAAEQGCVRGLSGLFGGLVLGFGAPVLVTTGCFACCRVSVRVCGARFLVRVFW